MESKLNFGKHIYYLFGKDRIQIERGETEKL